MENFQLIDKQHNQELNTIMEKREIRPEQSREKKKIEGRRAKKEKVKNKSEKFENHENLRKFYYLVVFQSNFFKNLNLNFRRKLV